MCNGEKFYNSNEGCESCFCLQSTTTKVIFDFTTLIPVLVLEDSCSEESLSAGGTTAEQQPTERPSLLWPLAQYRYAGYCINVKNISVYIKWVDLIAIQTIAQALCVHREADIWPLQSRFAFMDGDRETNTSAHKMSSIQTQQIHIKDPHTQICVYEGATHICL